MAIKAHAVRKGLLTTMDVLKEQDKPKKKVRDKQADIQKVEKKPVQRKKVKAPRKKEPEAALTRDQIKDSLKDIEVQRDKHEKSKAECEKELTSLQASFNDVKTERKEKVNEILEKNFMDQSEKSLVNKILTSTIKETKLHQLQDSISKLKAQYDWHSQNLRELVVKEKGLRAKLIILDSNEKGRACFEAYKIWKNSYFSAEENFETLKDSVIALRAVETDADMRFSKLGIDDYIFTNIVSSKFRGDLLNR